MRQTLEDGVHTIADTVRNSLNFYRMQENAETVDRAVLTGPAVADPGLRRARSPSSCRCRSSRPSSRPARRARTWAA